MKTMQKQIGLDRTYTEAMTEHLNQYLANVQIAYQNTRGYHWNIKGDQFFTLHEKFEELYDQLNLLADEIAERILMLGGEPVHAYSRYIEMASIPERQKLYSTTETVSAVVEELNQLISDERKIAEAAAEVGDEGTVNLVTDAVDPQEKMVWMFTAFLG